MFADPLIKIIVMHLQKVILSDFLTLPYMLCSGTVSTYDESKASTKADANLTLTW